MHAIICSRCGFNKVWLEKCARKTKAIKKKKNRSEKIKHIRRRRTTVVVVVVTMVGAGIRFLWLPVRDTLRQRWRRFSANHSGFRQIRARQLDRSESVKCKSVTVARTPPGLQPTYASSGHGAHRPGAIFRHCKSPRESGRDCFYFFSISSKGVPFAVEVETKKKKHIFSMDRNHGRRPVRDLRKTRGRKCRRKNDFFSSTNNYAKPNDESRYHSHAILLSRSLSGNDQH